MKYKRKSGLKYCDRLFKRGLTHEQIFPLLKTFSAMNKIMDRLAAQISRRVGMMLMQGKTTYTNDTALKQMNGLISLTK